MFSLNMKLKAICSRAEERNVVFGKLHTIIYTANSRRQPETRSAAINFNLRGETVCQCVRMRHIQQNNYIVHVQE